MDAHDQFQPSQMSTLDPGLCRIIEELENQDLRLDNLCTMMEALVEIHTIANTLLESLLLEHTLCFQKLETARLRLTILDCRHEASHHAQANREAFQAMRACKPGLEQARFDFKDAVRVFKERLICRRRITDRLPMHSFSADSINSVTPERSARSVGRARAAILEEPQLASTLPGQWDQGDVCLWLQRAGLDRHCAAFVRESIFGAALLRLTRENLWRTLGVFDIGEQDRLLASFQLMDTMQTLGQRPTAPIGYYKRAPALKCGLHYHALLTHSLTIDSKGSARRPMLECVNAGLQQRGLVTWLDAVQEGSDTPVYTQLTEAIRHSAVVVCCVTDEYVARITGDVETADHTGPYANFIFSAALGLSVGQMVACVMDAESLDAQTWPAVLRGAVGTPSYHAHFDNETMMKTGEFTLQVERLCAHIAHVCKMVAGLPGGKAVGPL